MWRSASAGGVAIRPCAPLVEYGVAPPEIDVHAPPTVAVPHPPDVVRAKSSLPTTVPAGTGVAAVPAGGIASVRAAFRRPPVATLPASAGSVSTPFRMALRTSAVVA